MQAMSFRDAVSGDEPAIQQLVFTVLREYGLEPDLAVTDADLWDVVSYYVAPGGCFRVLLSTQGQIVGCGGIKPLNAREAELRKMYLLPQARGLGLGAALLRQLIDFARARGCQRVVLDTASVLKDAIALYQRNGFLRQPLPAHLTPRCDQAYALELNPSNATRA